MKILKLGSLLEKQIDQVGGKARGLDSLIKAKLNVPAGFVIVDLDLDTDLSEAVEYYLNSGLGSVAVRSSASSEDGLDFSYAGQFITILNVQTAEEFKDALYKCIESLGSFTAKSYSTRFGGVNQAKMNIVVQKMVEASCAGVCFTTDPTNPENILVEAVEGLGEALVSGEASAIQYSVARGGLGIANTLPPLTDALLLQICSEAIKIQEVLGFPLDLEWAIDGDVLYWLQARPITALDECTEDEFNPKYDMTGMAVTRCNISEMLPGAVTPLSLSITVLAIDWGLRKMLHIAGANKKMRALPDFACAFSAHGNLFLNLSSLYRMTNSTLLAKKEDINRSICGRNIDEDGIVPNKKRFFLSRMLFSFKYIRFIMSRNRARRRLVKLADGFTIGEDAKTYAEIYSAIDNARGIANKTAYLHYVTSGHSGAMSSATVNLLNKHLKDEEKSREILAQLLEKIDGIESVDILASLLKIAEAILEDEPRAKDFSTQELFVYLNNSDESGKRPSDKVQRACADFMARHGHRAIREAELRSTGWAYDENAFAGYLKTVISGGMLMSQGSAPPDLMAIAKELGLSGMRAKMLVYYAKQAREGVKNREYSKSKLIKVFDVFKRAYSRLATLLVQGGKLPDEDAIFFLTHEEIGQVVNGVNPGLVKKALQRRRLLKTQEQLSFAEVYVGSPKPIEVQTNIASGEVIKGTPVSRGVATGLARVVRNAQDASELVKGEIMVASFTDIGWSPYYCLIDGLVTEVGGALSHGAVVAREYALPLVTNITGATGIIKTGDKITVDGFAGTVIINATS